MESLYSCIKQVQEERALQITAKNGRYEVTAMKEVGREINIEDLENIRDT